MTLDAKVCLECTLPICDDKSAECAFVQITRKPVVEKTKPKRAEYWHQYHLDNKPKRNANARRYRAIHRDEINAKKRAKRAAERQQRVRAFRFDGESFSEFRSSW